MGEIKNGILSLKVKTEVHGGGFCLDKNISEVYTVRHVCRVMQVWAPSVSFL